MGPGAEDASGVRPPVCTILAGPNGSGKSSIATLLRLVGEFVNADDIARATGCGRTKAARLAIRRLDRLIAERQDFIFETTLSSHHALATMRRARDGGYEVGLVFVALASADLNVHRVAERVGRGGHDIPEDDIRRRSPRSFANLARALPLAHGSLVYDNSERVPRLILRTEAGRVAESRLEGGLAHHALIARAAAVAFDPETGPKPGS